MTADRSDGQHCNDPRPGRRVLKLNPGEHAVTQDPDTLLLTVLGSCVAACIRDPSAGVGGMNHFMLPESRDGRWGGGDSSLRYGNFAMQQLINDLFRHGGRRERLEVKVFGGARIGQDAAMIGARNADYVEQYLRAEGIVPLVRRLRGHRAQRVAYLPVSGRAFMVELDDAHLSLDPEAPCRDGFRKHPATASVAIIL